MVLNTENRATPQPFVGRMMKTNNSQNWVTFENTDITFNIHRCVFDNTAKVVFKDYTQSREEVKFSLMNLNMSFIDMNTNGVEMNVKTINRSSVNDIVFDSEELMIKPNTNIEFDKLKYIKFNGSSFQLTVDFLS